MKRIISKIFCNQEERSIERHFHRHFLRESITGHLSFIEFGLIYRSYLENGRRIAHTRWIPVYLLFYGQIIKETHVRFHRCRSNFTVISLLNVQPGRKHTEK